MARPQPTQFCFPAHGTYHRVSMALDIAEVVQRDIYAHMKVGMLYENETAFTIAEIVRPGDIFVDIGANVGFFSLLASPLVGDAGRVLAFEPNPVCVEALRANIAINGFSNIAIRQAAASNLAATVPFHAFPTDGVMARNTNGAIGIASDPANQIHVQSVRGADVLAEERIGVVRCLKIDTEGHELAVLDGFGDRLRPQIVNFVVAEINTGGLHVNGLSPGQLRAFMRERGYSTYALKGRDMPIHIPDETQIRSNAVYNVLFATPEDVGGVWKHYHFVSDVERYNIARLATNNAPGRA